MLGWRRCWTGRARASRAGGGRDQLVVGTDVGGAGRWETMPGLEADELLLGAGTVVAGDGQVVAVTPLVQEDLQSPHAVVPLTVARGRGVGEEGPPGEGTNVAVEGREVALLEGHHVRAGLRAEVRGSGLVVASAVQQPLKGADVLAHLPLP